VSKKNKEDAFSLSCQAISFLKESVRKKQDLLSVHSQMEDRFIYQEVLRLEKRVQKGQVSLPVDLCIKCFQKLNKDYAERNIACTGIGRLGCFLIDYIFTHRNLKEAARQLYSTKEERGVYRQNEWYNHAIAKLLDLSAENNKKNILKNNLAITKKKCITMERS
jgi:hypothetical protein